MLIEQNISLINVKCTKNIANVFHNNKYERNLLPETLYIGYRNIIDVLLKCIAKAFQTLIPHRSIRPVDQGSKLGHF